MSETIYPHTHKHTQTQAQPHGQILVTCSKENKREVYKYML